MECTPFIHRHFKHKTLILNMQDTFTCESEDDLTEIITCSMKKIIACKQILSILHLMGFGLFVTSYYFYCFTGGYNNTSHTIVLPSTTIISLQIFARSQLRLVDQKRTIMFNVSWSTNANFMITGGISNIDCTIS